MTAGQQPDEHPLDHGVLADQHPLDLEECPFEKGGMVLDAFGLLVAHGRSVSSASAGRVGPA